MKQLLYIDLFCGAGGTSTGVERAYVDGEKCARVIACVNHDPNAIASHAANHPNALHYAVEVNMSMHLCKALYQKLNYNTKAERV